MTRKYDAIVIGAGLGGLSAATFLAKNGLRVLLLERHNVPGGYATSFVRGRFEFESALHALSGVGTHEKPGGLLRYLDSLGVADKVEFVQVPDIYRSVYPDLDVTFPKGREAYEAKLCEIFPHEADGIRRFMDRVWTFYGEMSGLQREVMGAPSISKLAGLPVRYPNTIRYNFATVSQVLNRDVKDPKARAVITQLYGYFGLPPSRLSFFFFALGLATYIKYGASFPKGRSQALSNAFISAFEEAGGEARMNCGVKRITTEDGRVSGVITEGDESFQADIVVSNADPVTTCRGMIGEESVPAKFFNRLRSTHLAAGTVNCFLGIAKAPEELGVTEHQVFINADYYQDRHGEMMYKLETPGVIAWSCYNPLIPNISPPGTSLVTLTTLSHGDPWLNLPPEEYVDTKNRIASGMLDLAEKICKGLRDKIEVIEVSTPITNMRYAGTLGGSILGFDNTPAEHTIWRIPHKGPVGGLYFAGAWTQPGGGFEAAIMSGQMAGSKIVHKSKKG